MMTANEIMGSLVYRTNRALNGNQGFLDALKGYYYYPTVAGAGGLHLWHFPGTSQEISQVFQALSKDGMRGGRLKFPGLLNFQSVAEEHGRGATVMRYNLAIVAPVLSGWTTQQREEQVRKLLLDPIKDEFINQIELFPHFRMQVDMFPYVSAYIPTTGYAVGHPSGRFPYVDMYIPATGRALAAFVKMRYGDFFDMIELPNLSVSVLDTCRGMSDVIVEESRRVTESL